jgi:pimeloyl-ACP methyl ester carboxylesterase
VPHLALGAQRIEYAFVDVGGHAAPTLVFLHEGLGSVALWKDFPSKVAAATGCNAVVYSRVGYGASTPQLIPREPDFMHVEALSVLPQILDKFEIHDPILFGHSDGASIALIHAGSAGRPVRGLIVMAPHVMIEATCIQSIAAVRNTYENTGLRDKLRRYHADPDGAFWGWCNIWLDPRFLAWNIEEHVRKIQCPVLVIQGFDDEYGTMEQVDRIACLAPHAKLLKLAACGHSPHRDQVDPVIGAASRHIEGCKTYNPNE